MIFPRWGEEHSFELQTNVKRCVKMAPAQHEATPIPTRPATWLTALYRPTITQTQNTRLRHACHSQAHGSAAETRYHFPKPELLVFLITQIELLRILKLHKWLSVQDGHGILQVTNGGQWNTGKINTVWWEWVLAITSTTLGLSMQLFLHFQCNHYSVY